LCVGNVITGIWLKAGSANHGNGLEYSAVDPPQQTVTISHSSGKDTSHDPFPSEPIVIVTTTPTVVPTTTTTPTTVTPTTTVDTTPGPNTTVLGSTGGEDPTDRSASTTLPTPDPAVTLPATGVGVSASALFGAGLLALGSLLAGLSRRRPPIAWPATSFCADTRRARWLSR
jgi:LPXTG-motif cell wall-anchored protein